MKKKIIVFFIALFCFFSFTFSSTVKANTYEDNQVSMSSITSLNSLDMANLYNIGGYLNPYSSLDEYSLDLYYNNILVATFFTREFVSGTEEWNSFVVNLNSLVGFHLSYLDNNQPKISLPTGDVFVSPYYIIDRVYTDTVNSIIYIDISYYLTVDGVDVISLASDNGIIDLFRRDTRNQVNDNLYFGIMPCPSYLSVDVLEHIYFYYV